MIGSRAIKRNMAVLSELSKRRILRQNYNKGHQVSVFTNKDNELDNYLKYVDNEEYHFRTQEKTYFPVGENKVHLLLYEGPSTTQEEYNSWKRTIIWTSHFNECDYQNIITYETKRLLGFPMGIVFNNIENEIRTFEDHIELDRYVKQIS